ncbi:MAG: hypothetical protein N3I35_09290 [Clostridia bacterium]|nr:hypothetical protein [Clostridia bacterium]
MLKDALIECTITMLNLLINQYEAGNLSYNDFLKNIRIKKVFLEEQINEINSVEDKTSVENMLKRLREISKGKSVHLNFSSSPGSTTVIM